MKKMIMAAILFMICAYLTGCGETASGVGKDVNRMGRGVSTFFFRQ